MSGLNWLKWVSRLLAKPDCPRSRRGVRNGPRSASESLEPRALLSGDSLLGSLCSESEQADANPPDDVPPDDSHQNDGPEAGSSTDDPCSSIVDSDATTEDTTFEECESTNTSPMQFRSNSDAANSGEAVDFQLDEENPDPDSETLIFFSLGAPQSVPQFTFSLAENSAVSTPVGSVTAADPDVNANISYSIIDGNEEGVFAIDPATGMISVANGAPLSFESSPTWLMTVQITDNSDPNYSGTAEVTINLTNVNEAPEFANTTLSVAENSSTTTFVGDVFASDPDVGSALQFTIISGNTAGAFAIDAYTGKVTVANGSLLNYESRSAYYLTVQVTDNGDPGLSATALVTVQVTNVDDPAVASFGSTIMKYRIGDDSVRFGTKAIVLDEDSPIPNFDGMILSATITGGRSNKDILSVKDSGSKSKKIVTRGDDIVYGRIVIGQLEGGRGDDPVLRITLNAFATKASVEALLRALSFSTKDTSTTTRSLAIQFSDANGQVLSTTTRSIPIKKKVEESRLPGWGFF